MTPWVEVISYHFKFKICAQGWDLFLFVVESADTSWQLSLPLSDHYHSVLEKNFWILHMNIAKFKRVIQMPMEFLNKHAKCLHWKSGSVKIVTNIMSADTHPLPYFFLYPTHPESVLKVNGYQLTCNIGYHPISGIPEFVWITPKYQVWLIVRCSRKSSLICQ